MENVTKALFIAAGFLLAVIIASLLVVGYNQISAYYQERSNSTDVEQIVEMNKKFINYDGKTIRGNEMISVINLVVDYNNWVENNPNEGYKKINFNVKFEGVADNWYNDFHITTSDSDLNYYDYLLNKQSKSSGITNSNMVKFSERMGNCLRNLQNIVPTATDKTLQLLASNAHTIHDLINKSNRSDEEDKKINLLMNNIFKINDFSVTTYNEGKRKAIDKIALQYYEITYFKRAYFDCTSVVQTENGKFTNGRVTEMNFKIETSGGKVKFN